ncbi:acyltransferase family protein [Maribacter chungangensis]|uniref:Acyltransferase family protein n=1 Tax=Maribacter chungangensis TaxID=1069117 RepID=A0ABW3B291_9FLAO
MSKVQENPSDRLLSLDFYRGLTMFLLIAEFSHLFTFFVLPRFEGTIVYTIGSQFHHVDWEGLHFWDLIQPFFMFIVGVAMPLSFSKRMAKGDSYKDLTIHAIKRAFLMLLLGWGLYCIDPGVIVFRFQNVLAQLGVAYILAFLVIRKSVVVQIGFSVLLLIITEGLYRFFPVEGFTNAFVDGENFPTWFNMLVSGEQQGAGWAMFNAIPTAAHTIWGVLAGQLLIGNYSAKKKLQFLCIAGVIGLVIGYGLSPITPIIKKIATSTFVVASGGWSLIALALCYWLIDIKKYQKGVLYFAVVGMNPLFIYLFAHVGGADLIKKIVLPFSNALFGWTGELSAQIILSCIVLFLLWYICYWMYKKKIFIRI